MHARSGAPIYRGWRYAFNGLAKGFCLQEIFHIEILPLDLVPDPRIVIYGSKELQMMKKQISESGKPLS